MMNENMYMNEIIVTSFGNKFWNECPREQDRIIDTRGICCTFGALYPNHAFKKLEVRYE